MSDEDTSKNNMTGPGYHLGSNKMTYFAENTYAALDFFGYMCNLALPVYVYS